MYLSLVGAPGRCRAAGLFRSDAGAGPKRLQSGAFPRRARSNSFLGLSAEIRTVLVNWESMYHYSNNVFTAV